MVVVHVVLWGLVAGIAHIVTMAVLYGNSLVARIHAAPGGTASAAGPRSRRFAKHMIGTQAEVYLMTVGFVWLHPMLSNAMLGTLALGLLFGALRVFGPVWALWLQANHSRQYLVVEASGGLLGSFVVVFVLHLLAVRP